MKTPAFEFAVVAGLGAAFAFAPVAFGPYALHLGVVVLIYATLALSWNISAAAGLVSLGHAGFFGLGAYAAAISSENGLAAVAGAVIAVVLGGGTAALVSLGGLRMARWCFAITTLGFSEAARVVVVMTPNLTNGPSGLPVAPIFDGDRTANFYAALGMTVLVALVTIALRRSRVWVGWTLVRLDETAASTRGVNAAALKVVAMVISGAGAAGAGAFYGHYTTFIDPRSAFAMEISNASAIMPIIGGLYSLAGPVLGAVLVKSSAEVLRVYAGQGHGLAYGIALVLAIVCLPHGIVGRCRAWHDGRRAARAEAAAYANVGASAGGPHAA